MKRLKLAILHNVSSCRTTNLIQQRMRGFVTAL